jgi:hypothetical protein
MTCRKERCEPVPHDELTKLDKDQVGSCLGICLRIEEAAAVGRDGHGSGPSRDRSSGDVRCFPRGKVKEAEHHVRSQRVLGSVIESSRGNRIVRSRSQDVPHQCFFSAAGSAPAIERAKSPQRPSLM